MTSSSSNNQDTYIDLHSSDFLALPYMGYVSILITPLLLLCLVFHCFCLCARKCVDNPFFSQRLIMKERLYLHEYATTVRKDTPRRERPRPPAITHVLNVLFAVENFWILMAWFVVNTYAVFGVALYSSVVQYWGLGIGIALSLLSTVLVVTHMFRARKIRSIGNNSRRIVKQMRKRGLLRRGSFEGGTASGVDNGGGGVGDGSDDDDLSNAADDLEKEINIEIQHEDMIALTQDVSDMEAITAEPGVRAADRYRVRQRSLAQTLQQVPMKAMAADTNPLGHITVNALEFYVRSVSYGIKKKIVPYMITLLLSMLIIAGAYIALFGLCICDVPFEVSTTLTRTFMRRSCEMGEICYTYLNLAEDPSTQIIIKFHTSDQPKSVSDKPASYVKYGTSEQALTETVSCSVLDFGHYMVDSFFEPHYVHTCELTGLAPDTTYFFVPTVEPLGSNGNTTQHISIPKALKFHTLHDSATADVRFISGGDMGLSKVGFSTLDVAIKQDPAFIAIGGDLEYGNAQITCYRRWDTWLRYYSENAVSPVTGAMIPILTALGNHEAEWGRFSSQPWNAKPYLSFFLHKIGIQNQGDDIFASNEAAYHAHKIGGHTLLMVLDSGVITPHGAQRDFIKNTLGGSSASNKIALYHAPLYPGARSFNGSTAKRGREMWEALFHDGGVKVAMENHDHVYKRTKRLGRDGKEVALSEPGIYYLGDGAIGTKGKPSSGREYIDKIEFINHVWLVECSSTGMKFSAIDSNEEVFDVLNVV